MHLIYMHIAIYNNQMMFAIYCILKVEKDRWNLFQGFSLPFTFAVLTGGIRAFFYKDILIPITKGLQK